MELSDLRIFRTVAEEGGIVKAARKLHRVQSSVSTRVRQLETLVGAELFHRDRQRLVLTSAGEVLLQYAERLLRLEEEARGAIATSPPRGTLKLGALESTAASRLPEIFARYHRAYPEVSIELTTGTNDALTAAVAARALDAAFVAEKPSTRDLAAMPAFSEHLAIIASATRGAICRPDDLNGDSLIAFPNGCAYRRVLQRWVGATRFSKMRVLELGSYHAIVACVAGGTGVAVVPESVLATVQHANIATHALPKVHARITTPLIWRRGERVPAVDALIEILRKRSGAARAA